MTYNIIRSALISALTLAAASAPAYGQSAWSGLPEDTPDTWAQGQPVLVSHERLNDRYDPQREITREACEQSLTQAGPATHGAHHVPAGHFWSGLSESHTSVTEIPLTAPSSACLQEISGT